MAQITTLHIRVNQIGYLPDAPKVAVACALRRVPAVEFVVVDLEGKRVFGPQRARDGGAFGPCAQAFRLDFSALRRAGSYVIVANGIASPAVRIADSVYRGAADTLLLYMRQQRSGFNPLFRDSVHERSDGMLVDHPTRTNEFIPVAGGWADAADYLQYVTTSANAAYVMLMAQRDYPRATADRYLANGLPGSNGVPDMLDEARHGLEWLLRMFPEDGLLLNQLGDDRDHRFWDLPANDSSDYGWGRGGFRPVYPCTGQPQGLLANKNRSTGKASTAGKFAAAFALGAQLFRERDAPFAAVLQRKATAAYDVGLSSPGVCQTAPAAQPYFYEEGNWTDDMELGAAQLYALTGAEKYRRDGLRFARQEPVTPW
ncbi:MAG TPA: glycoside hydrolase family 9 protein, partial [Longimicrobiales bacterium]